jgi:hypothetical protein
VLVTTLEKYGAKLHGAHTPVRDLWDRQRGKNIFRPIDENAISDVITRILEAELCAAAIFANREVEVSRAPGAPVGRRTDILVNAVRLRDNGERFDPITAVVEIKGCWNKELFTALEDQLFRDYMIPLRSQIGIYLVLWFDTDSWDQKDTRRRSVPKIAIEEAKAQLGRQASALPDDFFVRPVVLECRVPASTRAASRAKRAKSSVPRAKRAKASARGTKGAKGSAPRSKRAKASASGATKGSTSRAKRSKASASGRNRAKARPGAKAKKSSRGTVRGK